MRFNAVIINFLLTAIGGTSLSRRRDEERFLADSLLSSTIDTMEGGGHPVSPHCRVTVVIQSKWYDHDNESVGAELALRVPHATANRCIDPRRKAGWKTRLHAISHTHGLTPRMADSPHDPDVVVLSCREAMFEVQAEYQFARSELAAWADDEERDEVQSRTFLAPKRVRVGGHRIRVSRMRDVCLRLVHMRDITWDRFLHSRELEAEREFHAVRGVVVDESIGSKISRRHV